MVKLSQTPPLRTVCLKSTGQVQINLKEPFSLRKQNLKAKRKLSFINRIAIAELIFEKIHQLELWKLEAADDSLKSLHDKLLVIQTSLSFQQQKGDEEMMSELQKAYPRATQWLTNQNESQVSSSSSSSSSSSLFLEEQQSFNDLEQLYVIASRLYHDLELKDHRYIVYQLALLYQCINRQGVSFISFKTKIEQMFDEIKLSNSVQLMSDQTIWIQSLILDIIMQIMNNSTILKCGQIFSAMGHVVANKKELAKGSF